MNEEIICLELLKCDLRWIEVHLFVSIAGQEPSKQSHVTLGTSRQMSLTVTETDLTNLSATIRTPSGAEEPVGLKKQPNGQLGESDLVSKRFLVTAEKFHLLLFL